MPDEFMSRYRDRSGVERLSLLEPSLGAAIRHGRVLERHGGTVLMVVTPDAEVEWTALERRRR